MFPTARFNHWSDDDAIDGSFNIGIDDIDPSLSVSARSGPR